jgi:hypothetical protein
MGWIATGSILLAGSAFAQVHVTSLQGSPTAAGSPLALHSEIGENVTLEVPVGARCSLLLADRALVEVCGVARASFSGMRDVGTATVELEVGELKAIAPDYGPVSVQTPTASIVLQGARAHISVAPDSGDTIVSALDGRVSVSRRGETDATLIGDGQQLILRSGPAPGELRSFSRKSLARNNACVDNDTRHGTTLGAERAILIGGLPAVSAGLDGATGHRANDLRQIVKADFPADGLPLEDSATPSALVAELGKRGADEEICDPITCNPVFQLPNPDPCGIPPVRPCTP